MCVLFLYDVSLIRSNLYLPAVCLSTLMQVYNQIFVALHASNTRSSLLSSVHIYVINFLHVYIQTPFRIFLFHLSKTIEYIVYILCGY